MNPLASLARPGGLELTLQGLALCALPPAARVADIGCGAGATVRLLREMGHSAVGLDRSLSAEISPALPCVQGLAEALPFASGSLHGLVCECVLSLVEQPEAVLRGFARVCRVGGTLLLSDVYRLRKAVPDAEPLFSGAELASALGRTGWQIIHASDHTPALKQWAAQRLWYEPEQAAKPSAESCWPRQACGYGLWIARKEAPCTR